MRRDANEALLSSGGQIDVTERRANIEHSSIDCTSFDKKMITSSPINNMPLSATEGAVPSSSRDALGLSAAIVPFESHELAATPIKADYSPVNDDEVVWVGIGCGEAFTLSSVCSESPPESNLGYRSSRTQPVPKAIDFRKFESNNLPKVDEDRISNICSEILQQKQSVEKIGSQSVAELSVELSIMENSVATVMTREGCIDLAKRLEKMENNLMERAGETSRSDALRALAQAAHKQSKRGDLLQKRVKQQEKQNTELNHLCQQLINEMTENKRAQSKMQMQIHEINRKNAGQGTELHRYKSKNVVLKSKLDEVSERLQKMEEENSKKLLCIHSEKAYSSKMQVELSKLRKESRQREEMDKSIIQRLESDIAQLREIHATKEKRNERKVQILIDIRSALEEQICLLEKELSGASS